ncbi:MAG: hypothetical protein ACRDNW_04120 [Trebonia sp.]
MTGAPHRPFIDGSRGPQLGGLAAVACRDCVWAQAVNEDLHEGYEDRLMAWHAAHPDQGFDHLTDRDPSMRLEVPGYVVWDDNGFGCLAIADERTGGMHDSYNHACLAILRSVAEHGNLEAAEISEARRLGITPKRASGEVRLIATSLYRAGLLQPAHEGNARARP